MRFDESPPYQYCIYYRIHDNVEHSDLCITVRQMQQTLQSLTGVPGRLMWRTHDDRTYMTIVHGWNCMKMSLIPGILKIHSPNWYRIAGCMITLPRVPPDTWNVSLKASDQTGHSITTNTGFCHAVFLYRFSDHDGFQTTPGKREPRGGCFGHFNPRR